MNTDQLIQESRKRIHRSNSRFKHFTFIIVGKSVIACIGINNKSKTHPLAKKYDHRFHSTHSEINAIAKFPYPISYLKECIIVNIRLNKRGEIRLAKPCLPCQRLLKAFHVKNIYYSTNHETFEVLKL